MRFVHTSDWHLGRGFHGVGLQRAHEAYLDHLVALARAEALDAVLVSGDIYDRALPSPETVALLDDTLARLLDTGATVVLSSGNHDSAVRLGFGSRAMERAGLFIRTGIDGIARPVEVQDARIAVLPYLEPAVAAERLTAAERTHAAVLRAALRRVPAGPGPAIVMAHAFVTGATTCDSERDLAVGGVGAVPVGVFDRFDYAALGHLHGAQVLTDHARYSGSPVAMSFSEASHVKGSVVVDTATGRQSFIAAPVDRPLARLRGTLDELLADPRWRDAESAFCQVTLTDPSRPLAAMDRVRTRFPHTLQLLFDAPVDQLARRSYAQRVRDRSDLEVCCDFLPHVRDGAEATDAEREVLQRALDSAAVARRVEDAEAGARPGHTRATGAA